MRTLGRSHPLLKRIRRLRRSASARHEEGVLLVEGPHLVDAALAAGRPVDAILTTDRLADRPDGPALLKRLADHGDRVFQVTDEILDGLQDARSPQPVVALIGRAPDVPAPLGTVRPPWIVIAAGLQDPGNLGGLIRTAEAAGVGALWSAGDGADLEHPRAVRSTAGSIFRLPTWSTNWGAAVSAARDAGLALIATAADAPSIFETDGLGAPAALIVGNEGSGLTPAQLADADRVVSLPMAGGVESLSVGAAAAVLLYEMRRQRHAVSD